MKQKPILWPMVTGLQTTGLEDGLPFPALKEAQNVRFDRGVAKRRAGTQRVDRATNLGGVIYRAFDLDGTDDYVEVPVNAGIHTLKKIWTFDALVKPDTFTTQRTVLGVAHATDYPLRVYVTTGGKVEAKVQDSAATVTTLTSSSTYTVGTTLAIQVARLTTALTLRVNGASEATGAIADLDCKAAGGNLYLGRDNAGAYFDGVYDFARLLAFAAEDQAYGKTRLVATRASYVLMDMALQEADPGGAHARVNDRSRYENHGTHNGSPAYGTALCVQDLPCTGIATWLDADAKERLFFGAGDAVFLSELRK